jgi:hypothetical protein
LSGVSREERGSHQDPKKQQTPSITSEARRSIAWSGVSREERGSHQDPNKQQTPPTTSEARRSTAWLGVSREDIFADNHTFGNMESIAQKIKAIEAKFKLLDMTNNLSKNVLQSTRIRDIKRHLDIFESRLTELYELKTTVQEDKLVAGEEDEEVEAWGLGFNERTE